MKQKLLLKTMLLLFALIAGSSSVWADTVTFNYSDYNGQGTQSSGSEYTMVKTDVSITNTKFYCGSSATYAQFYASGVTTITPASGVTITQIVLTASGTDYNGYQSSGTITASTGSVSGNASSTTVTWSGSATAAFTISNNKQIRWTSIVVTYTKSGGGSSVATPTFDPAGGTSTSPQSVTISCATADAKIYYTIKEDGTTPDDPTESDDLFTSAISVTKSGTKIKAKAFKDGITASDVASATYTIKPSKPTVTAAGATVTITGQEGCTFYYTTDGTTPTNSSTEYTGSFDLLSDCTIKARAYDAYHNASDVYSFPFKYLPLEPKNINSGYFVKVTDVSDLENGDAILIVNEDNTVAMSTTQNSNNRGQAEVTITNDVINNLSADVQKLVLVKTTEKINSVDTDVFYFYTGSGYLYAASSSSNYLRTEAAPDNNNNARATIVIDDYFEDAIITFTGTYTHNVVAYNSTNQLFSCYEAGPQKVYIYKEVAHSETLTPGKTYTTLTSAYNLDFTGIADLEAYIATGVSGGYVQMTQVNKVPANTGLVLKATTPDSPVNVPAFDGTGADDVSGNKMAGSATATTAVAANAGYILSNGVFQPSSGGDLPAGKAYLNVAVSSAPVLNLNFGGDTTGISTLNVERGTLNDNSYYNLAGQRVTQPTKGLYIVNGKKVVIK